MRREADGRWSGDMTDGVALVAALRAAGCEPHGRRALVVGAGGAGSAVVLALAEAGARVAVHDIDAARRDDLVRRLAAWKIAVGSVDPAGCDLVVNATPLGMASGDPLPVEAARIAPGAVVADLVTKPAVTPLLNAARERGAQIVTGEDMFAPQAGILADFLLSGHRRT
jgi:shikimate dehydrogenase